MSPQSPGLREVALPSFDEVYRAEFSYVRWLVRRLGVPERLAEDATQEVFAVVHLRLPEYEPQDKLRGWLGAIARNVALKLRTRKSFAREIPHPAPILAEDERDPLDLLKQIASAKEVAIVLDEVEPELRWLFIQHHLFDVPVPEIAKHLGIGVNTATKRLWIARREVRAAWLRHEARARRAGGSKIVPILGPLTFQEAGRQIPEAPEDVRARAWERVQEQIGGGGPGSGPRARTPPAPRLLARSAAAGLAGLAGLGGMAVGVLAGAVWSPFHRVAQAPAIVQVMTAPPSVTPPSPEAPPPPPAAEAAPTATSPALMAPTASSAGDPVDLDNVLVNRAEAALRDGQVEPALASLQRHATVFHGGGRRAHDRDVVWIAVLIRAGRTEEARQRLVSFARTYPRSPRLDDFRRTLGAP